MKRQIVGALRSLAVAFSVAASFSVVAPVTAAEPLKIGYSDWPGWIAWEVAIQKDFFKEVGVDVKFEWMEYVPSMEAFSAGKIDAVNMTNGDALVNGATGKASTAILLTDYSNGNDMIIAGPGIESIKDLKGKSVGVELNFVDHLLLLKGLEANGMTEADVKLVNFPTNETPQALASKGVDAIGAWYPVAGQALKQVAGSKPIYTSKDAPGLIYDALYVSRESLASRRDDWKKVTAVWLKTVAFIKDPATKDEAIKIMAARVSVPPEEYAKSLEGTFLLDGPGNLKHMAAGDGLDSVVGSSKIVDDFNVKNKVYETPQEVQSYLDDTLMKEVAK